MLELKNILEIFLKKLYYFYLLGG